MMRWRIGDVTVTRIVELDAVRRQQVHPAPGDARGGAADHLAAAAFRRREGRLKMSVHALVVETPGRRIVVDTCIGNDKPRAIRSWNQMQTDFLADLEAAGFRARASTPCCAPICTSTTSAGTPCWLRTLGPDLPQRPLSDGPHGVRALAGAIRRCRPPRRLRQFRGAGLRRPDWSIWRLFCAWAIGIGAMFFFASSANVTLETVNSGIIGWLMLAIGARVARATDEELEVL